MSRPVAEMFSLAGKTAWITGASRGLGLQIAHGLGEMGARLILSARKQTELDEAVLSLAEKGIAAVAVPGDLTKDEALLPWVQTVLDQHGPVDILVNNAGATWGASAEDYPLEAWDKVMDLNVRALFRLTQAVGKHCMIPRRSGCVLNVASIAAWGGHPPGAIPTLAYSTSKAAIVNFTRALACEWGRYGINVNALAPGFFPTKMTRATLAQHGDEIVRRTPLGKLGGEDDLKGAAVLLVSDAGRHITGQTLAIDGGVSAVMG